MNQDFLKQFEDQVLPPSTMLAYASVRAQLETLEVIKKVLYILESQEKKQTMKKEKAPTKGKMKKCPNCGKSYAGDKCPCMGKGKPGKAMAGK